MNLIDYQDSRPIYEQIVENFKLQMYKGILQADDQMPSVRSLAMELSTNPNTVQKAYAELERQGFIYTVKGRGNFVKGNSSMIDNKKSELIESIVKLFREAEDVGIPLEEIIAEIKDRLQMAGGANALTADNKGLKGGRA
ncbi:GntR family transcriptional regulator [Butyrivibrio sp. VCB2006]|uniref:GntR family transcriptional regulator n=1 Tax=Butyrivibrio sp. VCB2006 TaxID=1280679 RepID=UPI00041ED5BD|nr:GntR family transcriptional regulator [Butyrivibrio sp. VCB2006]